MELMINGREADLSDFEADELAQAVLISLFHGESPIRMTASMRRIVKGGGVTHTPSCRAIALAHDSGFCNAKRSLQRRFVVRKPTRRKACSG